MRHVDRHADLVHPLDDRDAVIAQTIVATFGRAVADEIARIVRELRHALAHRIERIDIVRTSELFRVL